MNERATVEEISTSAGRIGNFSERLKDDEVYRNRFTMYLVLRGLEGSDGIEETDPIGIALLGVSRFTQLIGRVTYVSERAASLSQDERRVMEDDESMQEWLSAFDDFETSLLVQDQENVDLTRGGGFITELRAQLSRSAANG